MNKWGIMVDISHPSKGANMQAIALSKAPVIASHSAARALANHSRNIDDELLAAIKKNGGVVQTVAFASYVKVDPAERYGGAQCSAAGIRSCAASGAAARGPARGARRRRGARCRRAAANPPAAAAAGAAARRAGAGRGGGRPRRWRLFS